MCNILICLDKQPTPELLDAIMVTLAQGGFDGIASTPGDNLTLIAKAMVDATNSSPSTDEFAIEIPPMDLPAPTEDPVVDIMAALAPMVPPVLPAPEVPSLVNPGAAITPAALGLPNAIIKSLSLSTQVKAVYDPALTNSELRVSGIQNLGNGLIQFVFGGVEYKYPTKDEAYISIVISFAGAEDSNITILLAVVPLVDGQLEELVIGSNDQSAISTYLA